jgi:TPR repeat protein
MTWYLKAVDKGDHSAMFNIGTMYREGKGVPKDANQAVAWYTKSANAGESVAMYNLGMMYYKGDEIPANREQALIWLKKFLPGQNPDGTLAKEANKAIADMEGR